MTRTVQCIKLNKQADGLDMQVYPGDLGKKIFENVSKEAWQMWLQRQTMLMNEKRLTPINPEHRKYLEEQMEAFFFGEGGDAIEGYVPPSES